MAYEYPTSADPLAPNNAHANALQLIGSNKRDDEAIRPSVHWSARTPPTPSRRTTGSSTR